MVHVRFQTHVRFLNCPITIEEIESALKKLKLRRSGEANGLQAAMHLYGHNCDNPPRTDPTDLQAWPRSIRAKGVTCYYVLDICPLEMF